MITDYQRLKPLMRNYVFDEKFIYADLGKKEITGVILSSSSLVRKPYTLNRIKNLILKNNFKLKVSEEGFIDTERFIIK